eukprot:3799721-Prorocentrum_lima.AAC.1
MVPAETLPPASATPPMPAPHEAPPPPGTALAALFPYVVRNLDASVLDQLQRVKDKAKAKAKAAVIPTPVRAGVAASSSAL